MLERFLNQEVLRSHARPGLPWPASNDRDAWERLSGRDMIIAQAREAAGELFPLLTASQFMAFVKQGDRQRYELPYFARRHKLIRLAIGEAIEAKGALLDQVIDGLWLLAEETSWVISAHNVDPHPGSPRIEERILPDVEDLIIDLFAAQTGATVSLCCHLLGEQLTSCSPQIISRMRREVETRLITPFLTRDDFWWMGITRQDLNNWTPWILSNVLICLLYWVEDRDRLAFGLYRAAEMLDRYLACLPDDGALDEGVAYWNMAGASVLDCLVLLKLATGGWMDIFSHPKIRAIARFPLLTHIDGSYYLNFADCDAQPWLDGERVHHFGRQVGDDALQALGRDIIALHPSIWPGDTPQMSRVLDRLFFSPQIPAKSCEPVREGVVTLPGISLWACRKGALYAAIKGGHNGENHNHNDLGSFILYLSGQPAVIDVGNMTYTAKTFSPERYTLFNTRSANHNLPLIGPYEQASGTAHRAKALRMNGQGALFSLEEAYPKESGLLSYTREARLDDALRITDEITLSGPLPINWVFMLADEPDMQPGRCRAGNLLMSFPEELAWLVTPHEVKDARLARNYPGRIYRLCLIAAAGLRHSACFIMEESKNA